MSIILIIITILAVLLLVYVLVHYLRVIIKTLTSIGGNGSSSLAKLRVGLRAIETETGHLPIQVTKLNGSLTEVAGGLKIVDDQLEASINAALKQKV